MQRRALLGDKQAQKECAEEGVVLPLCRALKKSVFKEAEKQKWKRILVPLLKDILDEGVEIKIDIDNDDNLCINDTPIGNVMLISNFRSYDSGTLLYYYKHAVRYIDFEELYDFFQPPRKKEIQAIYELTGSGSLKTIYLIDDAKGK